MSDRDKKQNNGDLIDIKSLIGDADGGDYSLDDIMAEYGRAPAPPEEDEARFNTIDLSKIPRPARQGPPASPAQGRVVAFPGGRPAKPEEPAASGQPQPDPEKAEEPAPVIPFPQEESVLGAFLKDLGQKANDYADHMFEEDESIDKQEVRRLERLIPGTDREEPPAQEEIRWQRPRRRETPPPDTSPKELAKRYGRGLKWMRVRVLLIFLLALLSLAQTAIPLLGGSWPSPMDQMANQCWASAAQIGRAHV